jgi:hypothetical protein
VEREFNFHAPPKSTYPATAAVSSVASPAESPNERLGLNSPAAWADWQTLGVRRFSADGDD